jgi:hypothetical protein
VGDRANLRPAHPDRRKAPQTRTPPSLDRDLRQLVVDLPDYDEYRAQLNGAYQAAIDKVANIAKELHDVVWTVRQRHEDLEVQARNLRVTARWLHRRRVQGELVRLGHRITASTVWQILHDAGIDPAPRRSGPTWRRFLTAQVQAVLAVDFRHVNTVFLGRIYALIAVEHGSRRAHSWPG